MTELPFALALFLLANLAVALWRVLRGPTQADRMLVAVLFGTTGVAILLLLAEAQGVPALIDAALVFALLAAIAGAAFSVRAWRLGSSPDVAGEGADDPD
ncbi:MAG: monovalent cation/H+ antiporter complex subunit F [Gammaproteobacteria bacterium]|nr:monovalent cation/H+ antiporter complex subunit F [Gammaproteobacteria bacterium]